MNSVALLKLSLSLIVLFIFSCAKQETENKSPSKEIKKENKELQFYLGFSFNTDTNKDLKIYYNDTIFYYKNEAIIRDDLKGVEPWVAGEDEQIYLKGKRVENYEQKKILIEKFNHLAKIVDADKLVNIDWHSKNNQFHKTDFTVEGFTIKKIGKDFFYFKNSKKELICKDSKITSFNSLDIDNDNKPELLVFETEVNPKYDFLETSCSVYKVK